MGKPLDKDLMASYMSPATANAIFGQKLGDDPAYVRPPAVGAYAEAREALKQRYIDDAWNELHEAETFEQQRHAVMNLSDMVFGDDGIDRYKAALDADAIVMAAATATPPAMVRVGTVFHNVKFFGIVSDEPGTEPLTLELKP